MKPNRLQECVLLAFAALALVSAGLPARGAFVNVPLSDDASTYSFETAGGFGPASVVPSSWHTAILYGPDVPNARTYFWMKFDLATVPAGAEINSVTLKCYGESAGNAPGYHIGSYYVRADNWSEDTITWYSQPAYGIDPTATDSVLIGQSGIWSWDVTSAIQDSYDGDSVATIVLKVLEESVPDIYNGYEVAGAAFSWVLSDTTGAYLEIDYTVVPEPSTCIAGALLLLPFAGGIIRKLRRQ